jgi:hypothetical protein
MSWNRSARILMGVSAFGILISCTQAPSGPQKGTPAYYWQAAHDTFAAGDYNKTLEHLDQILATQNDFTARAVPWSLVITSGMAAGYTDLAENFIAGSRANRKDPEPFRRPVRVFRELANRQALQFAETYGKLEKLPGENIPLAFPLPIGSAAQVPALARLAAGILIPQAEQDTAQESAVQRGVLLAACKAAGAPNDVAKTEQLLKSPDAQVPKSTFLFAMAQALYDNSQLYTNDKLDQPQKMEALLTRAQAALKTAPATKDAKELTKKIQAALKKIKKT